MARQPPAPVELQKGRPPANEFPLAILDARNARDFFLFTAVLALPWWATLGWLVASGKSLHPVAWFFAIVVSLMPGWAVHHAVWYRRVRREWPTAIGEIARYQLFRGWLVVGDTPVDTSSYWPVVRFTTQDNAVVELRPRHRPWRYRDAFGRQPRQVLIRYPTDKPQHAFIDVGWSTAIYIAALSLLLAGPTLVVLLAWALAGR